MGDDTRLRSRVLVDLECYRNRYMVFGVFVRLLCSLLFLTFLTNISHANNYDRFGPGAIDPNTPIISIIPYCTTKNIEIYKIMSPACLEAIIMDYDGLVYEDTSKIDTDDTFKWFLYKIFYEHQNWSENMPAFVQKLNIGTKRLVISALMEALGQDKVSKLMGMARNTQAINSTLRQTNFALDDKPIDFTQFDQNISANYRLWALFAASGSTEYLKSLMNYLLDMPAIIHDMYPEYAAGLDHSRQYGILPPLDKEKLFKQLDDFMAKHASNIDEYNKKVPRYYATTIWGVASYLLVIDHMRTNYRDYEGVREAITKIVADEPKYNKLFERRG